MNFSTSFIADTVETIQMKYFLKQPLFKRKWHLFHLFYFHYLFDRFHVFRLPLNSFWLWVCCFSRLYFNSLCARHSGSRNGTILPLLACMFCLISQCRSCDNTQKSCSIQISPYSRANVRIIYEKTKRQIPLRPSLGEQSIQAKEVY